MACKTWYRAASIAPQWFFFYPPPAIRGTAAKLAYYISKRLEQGVMQKQHRSHLKIPDFSQCVR